MLDVTDSDVTEARPFALMDRVLWQNDLRASYRVVRLLPNREITVVSGNFRMTAAEDRFVKAPQDWCDAPSAPSAPSAFDPTFQAAMRRYYEDVVAWNTKHRAPLLAGLGILKAAAAAA